MRMMIFPLTGAACFILIPMLAFTAMSKNLRNMKYAPGTPDAARAWQQGVRAALFDRLHLADLVAQRTEIPLEASAQLATNHPGYTLQPVRLRSTPGRFLDAIVAYPEKVEVKCPAVVCIHGHGGTRVTPFDEKDAIYKCFGAQLAQQGYIVISTDVGRHEIYESGRTLMGERLWDLMRCVDYLASLPQVDSQRIGCAGLSLGGEMAMWLGAMDERIAATVSCGFLTWMDQMEHNHCLCWKFDGLRELVDFPDIYSLIAPRALQCQNGLKEPDTQFTVPLARTALKDIERIYRDLGAGDKVELVVHDGGHEISFEPMAAFLSLHLGTSAGNP